MTGKSRKNKKLLVFFTVLVLGFAAVFIYYAYDYYQWWQDGQAAQEQAEMVQEIFTSDLPSPIAFETAVELTHNTDIVAYISILGTKVGNVVVQGEDNAFYLYRDMFGNQNVNGSLFLDYRNSPFFTDENTIIYGHNMNNGTMFHNLRYFVGENRTAFVEEHPYITLILPGEVLVYEIFSAFVTTVDFNYIQTSFAPGEFAQLVEELNSRDILNIAPEATGEDQVLLLSTCTNISRDTRVVVAGRLIERIRTENA